ncbi:twin-arginine translocation signal domain-containing protein, partial [bacterium]|nr:twin-arginine translocation signal domain-containing protein [bacterium]
MSNATPTRRRFLKQLSATAAAGSCLATRPLTALAAPSDR